MNPPLSGSQACFLPLCCAPNVHGGCCTAEPEAFGQASNLGKGIPEVGNFKNKDTQEGTVITEGPVGETR